MSVYKNIVGQDGHFRGQLNQSDWTWLTDLHQGREWQEILLSRFEDHTLALHFWRFWSGRIKTQRWVFMSIFHLLRWQHFHYPSLYWSPFPPPIWTKRSQYTSLPTITPSPSLIRGHFSLPNLPSMPHSIFVSLFSLDQCIHTNIPFSPSVYQFFSFQVLLNRWS